ncbi:fibronectin type III domain-containing protein [Flagellimonas sp. 2504JD4-2]
MTPTKPTPPVNSNSFLKLYRTHSFKSNDMKNTFSLGLVLALFFVCNTANSQELHTHSNAASIANEANSVSGWGGSASRSSVNTDAYAGTYSIRIESTNGGWNYSSYSFPTTAGEQYVVSFYAKSASTTNPALYWAGGGVVENQKIQITSSGWAQYSKTVTASGTTIGMNVYPGSPALAGEHVFIDNFSVMPIGATDTQAPTAPTLSSTAHSENTVDLSWNGATDNVAVTGYNVYQDGTEIANNIPLTIYQATGLSASTAYNFVVRALDAAGNESADSNSISVTTNSAPDTQAPSAPTALHSSGQTDTTVDLSWNAATDNVGVTGYNVYRDGSIMASDVNATSYQADGLSASTAYSFTVSALDAAGNESAQSTAVPVTTDAASGGGGSSVWAESGSTLSHTGEVAIGTSSVPSGYKLAVDGDIRTRKIRVDQDTWPDYVFKEGYDLPTLEEIQQHINEKGHLPNIPSAKEVKTNGVELGEMDRLLLQKIEELTLYILKLENDKRQMEKRIIKLEKDKL